MQILNSSELNEHELLPEFEELVDEALWEKTGLKRKKQGTVRNKAIRKHLQVSMHEVVKSYKTPQDSKF